MESICQKIRELGAARNEIVCENSSLAFDIETIDEDLTALKSEIYAGKQKACNMQKEISQFENRNARDEEKLKGKNDLIKELQGELREQASRNSSLQLNFTTSQNELRDTKAHYHLLESCIDGLLKTESDTQWRIQKFLAAKEKQADHIQHVKETLCKLKQCLKNASCDLEDKFDQVDMASRQLNNNETLLDKLTGSENNLQRRLKDAQEKTVEINSKLRQECKASEALKKNVCNAEETARDIENQLKVYAKEAERMKQVKARFLREIKSEISKLREDFKKHFYRANKEAENCHRARKDGVNSHKARRERENSLRTRRERGNCPRARKEGENCHRTKREDEVPQGKSRDRSRRVGCLCVNIARGSDNTSTVKDSSWNLPRQASFSAPQGRRGKSRH